MSRLISPMIQPLDDDEMSLWGSFWSRSVPSQIFLLFNRGTRFLIVGRYFYFTDVILIPGQQVKQTVVIR